MTPEAKVKRQIREVLEHYGAYYSMPVTGGYGASGVPDFLICYMGRFIGVEAKTRGNNPTALQLTNMKRIELAGGKVLVVNEDNIGELKHLLEIMK